MEEEEDEDDEDDDDDEEKNMEEEKEMEVEEKEEEKEEEIEKSSHLDEILGDAEEGKTIFIRNIPLDATEKDLYRFFKKYGSIEYVKLCKDKCSSYSIYYSQNDKLIKRNWLYQIQRTTRCRSFIIEISSNYRCCSSSESFLHQIHSFRLQRKNNRKMKKMKKVV